MRRAVINRKTKETRIDVNLGLDGRGHYDIETGIRFLDHMLAQLARHGLFDIQVKATGDLHIDSHHTAEDVGIVIGRAFNDALGDRQGIRRMGDATVPMDEALVEAALDIGGRPYYVGQLPSKLYAHFLHSFATNLEATLHVRVLRGQDRHHIVEAAIKATGLALREAIKEGDAVFSTKGSVQLERLD